MNISDHGENDPIPFNLSDTDRAIAGHCKHAIAQHRYFLNARDALARKRYEQAERDYHTHNRNLDGQS